MHKYSQPEFYHFSRDSIELSSYAAAQITSMKNTRLDVLDLFSGCAVVGIEFFRKVNLPGSIVFVEKQSEFITHIRENLKYLSDDISNQTVISDITEFSTNKSFDIILANPPFFLNDTGRKSKSPNKKICHFLSEEEFECFINFLFLRLKKNGHAFFLGRDDQPYIKKFVEAGQIHEIKKMNKTSIFTLLQHKID